MDTSNPTLDSLDEILIVEDSATQAERLKYILEKNHYRFNAARNGLEALAQIAVRPPMLVISDIVMPGMDGYQLCRHLKQDPALKNIPVILLTSLNDPIDVVRGLECGADNFIFKPYNEDYLLSRVAYILANRHLRETDSAHMGVEVFFANRKFFITSDRLQILNLLLSTYETAVERNRALSAARDDLRHLNENLEVKVAERTAALQQEIAERKQAEAHVREQAELLNKARDAIIAVNVDRRITYWNASAERLYGWSAAEALGLKIDALNPYRSRADFLQAEAAVLAQGEWRGDYPILTKSGDTRHVESTWSLVRGPDDAPKSLLIINTDVTERKKLESDLLRAQRMEGIGMLAGGVAHDLNNALAPILMAAELLRGSDISAEQHPLLDMIYASAKRGADMVKQVLTFARGTSGERGHVQIKHLLREMGDLCRQTFPKNIDIQATARSDLPPLLADPTQLHQVLLNLCVNARDAMPDGGVLTLDAQKIEVDESSTALLSLGAKPGAYVALVVADTGIGMAPEVRARIFDPFFTTKTSGKGTGFGLTTVQTIARNHGGFVQVESTLGVGTEFKVHFPANPAAANVLAPAKSSVRPMGAGELILVVDDEAAIRNIATQTLEAFGYRVLNASNGAQAIALCEQHRENLRVLITDRSMPVMDGLAAISAIRAIAPHVRAILASGANTAIEDHPDAEQLIHAHLNKPYSADHLLQVVHDVLHPRTETK